MGGKTRVRSGMRLGSVCLVSRVSDFEWLMCGKALSLGRNNIICCLASPGMVY